MEEWYGELHDVDAASFHMVGQTNNIGVPIDWSYATQSVDTALILSLMALKVSPCFILPEH